MSTAPRIIFFALRELHVPVLLPVYREVARLGQFECGFIAPAFQRSEANGLQEGLSEATLTSFREQGIPFWGHEPSAPGACVVVADACYDRIEGWGPAVCIGHGTISKSFYFTDRPSARRENFAHVLCVPGPWYVKSFGDQLFTRVVPTGFSKMDELAAPAPDARARVHEALGLDPSKRTILFAPTFNPELTALAILLDAWTTLDPACEQVIFKLHGATDEAWKTRYRELASGTPNLRYVDAASLAPYMLACDVLVSDVSSAYVEGLVTGKPVIVVNNPLMTTYPNFNASDVEYAVRDAAYQVRDGRELADALEQLKRSDPLASRRAEYAERLFAPRDGRNSARIADEVMAVARGDVPHALPHRGDRMSVFVPDGVADMGRIEANIRRAWTTVGVFTRSTTVETLAGLRVQTLRPGQVPPQPFICLTGETDLPDGWDVLWFMASHFNPGAEGVFGPMLPDREAFGTQRHTQFFPDAPRLSDRQLQATYKHHAFDQLAVASMLRADGVIVSKGVPREIASMWISNLRAPAALVPVAKRLLARGQFVGVLPGLFAVPGRPPSVATASSETRAGRGAVREVLCYCLKNVHLAIFAPVVAAIRAMDSTVRIRFTAPPQNVSAREGLTDRERDEFAAETGAEWVVEAEAPRADVVLVADCVADRLRRHRRIVNLGHGLISKGQYFGTNALIGRENLADAICVPGPWHEAQLRSHLYIPIHVTGMSKLDALFAPFDAAAFRAAHQLPSDGRIILWCPTFNMELSSVPVIWSQIRRLTPLGHVVIKLHGATDPFLVNGLRARLAGEPGITWGDPSRDATPYMRASDLLITDVSSVMFEFAALDRPVVLVDNPHQSEYPHFDPSNVEYAMRDLGVRVRTVDELAEAVRAELADPARRHDARRRATQAMFAATDGRNSERIARIVLERPTRAPWLGPFDAVLPEYFTATDAAFCAPGLTTAANVIGPARLASAAANLRFRGYETPAERDAHLRTSESETVVLFRRRARLIGDWRAPLLGPLYVPEGAPTTTAPLTTGCDGSISHVGRHLKRDRLNLPPRMDLDVLAGVIRITNPGEWTPVEASDSPVMAARRARVVDDEWRTADWTTAGAVPGVLVGDALAGE